MATARQLARTRDSRSRFLATLGETGNVSAAARAAGVSRRAAYNWRDDPEFAALWDAALVPAAVEPVSAAAGGTDGGVGVPVVVPPAVAGRFAYWHPHAEVLAAGVGRRLEDVLARPGVLTEAPRQATGVVFFGGPVDWSEFGIGEPCPSCGWVMLDEARHAVHAAGFDELVPQCARQDTRSLRERRAAENFYGSPYAGAW